MSVNVLPAEWYEALSRGTIDGILGRWFAEGEATTEHLMILLW